VLEDAGLTLAERLDQRREMTRGHDPADADRHRVGLRRGHPENAGKHQTQNGQASLHPPFHPDVSLPGILAEPAGEEIAEPRGCTKE
jgi:hypothetical protein